MRNSTPLAFVALAACSSSSSDGPGIPIDSAPRELAKTVCPKAYSCCTPSMMENNELAGTDEPSCEVKTEDGYRNFLDGVKASVDKGRAIYRGDNVEACLEHVRSSPCETLNVTNRFPKVPHCGDFIEPKVAIGGACENSWECIDGSCAKTEGEREGQCAQYAKEGQFCGSISCTDDLTCDLTDMTCKRLHAAGEMCTDALECESGHCTKTGTAAVGSCDSPAADKCFYASSCSAIARGPGDVLLLSMLALAIKLAARKRAAVL